jgi:hypothetical protein
MDEWFWFRNAAGRNDMCRMGQGSRGTRDGLDARQPLRGGCRTNAYFKVKTDVNAPSRATPPVSSLTANSKLTIWS